MVVTVIIDKECFALIVIVIGVQAIVMMAMIVVIGMVASDNEMHLVCINLMG